MELVTGIFFGDMGGTMWVGETAVTCLDGHSRCFFMLDINTMKLFVRLEDLYMCICGPGSSVGIATGYRLDGPWIESGRWRDFPHLS